MGLRMKSMDSFTKSRRTIAEINIVPYVDVMLVLLVIFMVTAPLITQGVKVDLPEAQASPLSPEGALPVVVTVNEAGDMYLNIAEMPNQAISPNQLQIEVAAALLHDSKRQVMVRGDKKVSYSAVLEAMVLLQQAGVPSVGLETSDVSYEQREKS